ncbi:MAG: HlyC/CorC family transporter [Alphaproteobacteria bacterium]|nr:HlyC/CorC family transporter [Alphaproteobacteria bacterium]
MTTTAEPSDPSSSPESQESTAPQRLGQRVLALLRRFRPQRSDRDAIETILEQPQNHETSDFDADERKMLSNILQLKHRTVEDVLVPRAEIIAVDVAASIDDVIELAAAEGHSRLPVFGDDMDDIRGLVHIKDLLAAKARGSNEGIDAILRVPIFVAPSMPVLDMLLDMRTKRRHMAFVVDEHGGIDGLLTIEDLVEEIVGDIQDEHDENEGEIVTIEDNEFEAHARLELSELEAKIGRFLTDEDREEDVETLGGLVFAMAGRVPLRGEVLTHSSGWRFTVMEADPRRIRRVHIELASNPLRRRRRLTPPEPAEAARNVDAEGSPDTSTTPDPESASMDAAEVEGADEGQSEAAAKPRLKSTPKPKPKPAAKPKAKAKAKAKSKATAPAQAPAQAAGD